MKKVIAILFLFLFVVNEFSFLAVYIPLKELATFVQKSRFENYSESDDFTLIVINESEQRSSVMRFINESEIFFNGELYDVVNTITKEGKIYYYCLKDETENLLDKSFDAQFDNVRNNKFSLTFFNHTVAKKLIAFVFLDDLKYGISQAENMVTFNILLNLNPFLEKHSPPPKIS